MQVFAQKSVLVVSICFLLIALICTDIPCFRANPCSSVRDNFPLIALINTDISCFRADPCTSVGHHISLRSAQKSQLSKPSVSVLVWIV